MMRSRASAILIALLSFAAGLFTFAILDPAPAAKARPQSRAHAPSPLEAAPGCETCDAASRPASVSAAAAPVSSPRSLIAVEQPRSLTLKLLCRGMPLAVPMAIELSAGRQRLGRRWSPERPRFELPSGPVTVTVGTELGEDKERRVVIAAAEEGSVERSVELGEVLGLALCLRGLERGQSSCVVRVEPAASGEVREPSEERKAWRPNPVLHFGRWRPGLYRVTVSYDGHCAETAGIIDYPGGPLCVELTAPRPLSPVPYPYEALDHEGRRVTEEVYPRLFADEAAVEATREPGRLLLRCFRPRDLPPLMMRVSSERYGEARAPAKPEAITRLRLAGASRLTVRLPGARELGYGHELVARWSSETENSSRWSRGPEGLVIDALRPGPGTLTIANWRTNRVFARRELDLKPGDQTAAIVLPRVGALEVELRGEPASSVAISGQGLRLAREFYDRRRARFLELPYGVYKVSIDGETREARVPGPLLVFRRPPLEGLRVRITDQRGPYYRNGLRDGDLILAIEGRRVTREMMLYHRCRATVRRGDRDFNLTLDLPKGDLRSSFGGFVEALDD